jgi:hypothetical protein
MERFIQRAWRRTCEKICLANRIPPGFRIVLLDEDGRVKRADLLVRSGGFAAEPGSFRIWAFLESVIENCVKNAHRLDYVDVELRDHRDRAVDPNLTLRRVRDMPGAEGKHTKAWGDNLDTINELEAEIEEALSIFDDDFRLADDQERDLLLKALIHYIISRFDIDALEYVLDFHKPDIERVRAERG